MMPDSRKLDRIAKALRWIPSEMPGKSRLASCLLGSYREMRDVIIDGRHELTLVTPSLREPVGFRLFVDGVYEAEVLDFAFGQLGPKAVVIDVGANIGAFTLPIAKKVGSAGCVIAIEASPRVFPYLRRNVGLNELSNVRPIQTAAFNRDWETVPFYDASIDNFGKGSLGAHYHSDPVFISTRTIDSILNELQVERVDLIKLDVEGSEASVFEGAERLLTRDRPPTIIFEFCDWAEESVLGGRVGYAQQLLRDWGYQIWRLKDAARGKAPLTNVLTTGFEMLVATRNIC